MLKLILARRFGPLFGVQYLTAFNDNLFRFGLLFLVTYRLLADDPQAAAQLVTLAGALFILPFALFSGLAGEIADAVCKARAIRWIKFAEIVVMGLGVLAIVSGSIPFMFLVLFLMGLQSTFFGPIKYAIVPQHLEEDEITGGTALIEAGTYVAILSGQLAGGVVSTSWLMAGVLVVAAAGFVAAQAVPPAPPVRSDVRIDWNPLRSAYRALGHVRRLPHLWMAAILGSWFWMLGIVFTSLFIPLVKGDLGGTEGVANLFVAAFSVGVALGSLVIGRYLGARITASTLPLSLIAMTAATAGLYLAIASFAQPAAGQMMTAAAFLASGGGLAILLALVLFSMAAGTFIVPIYAVLISRSDAADRAKTIAGYNIMNSGAMVAGALSATGLLAAGMGVPEVLLIAAGINLPMIWAARRLQRALPMASPEPLPQR